jgi:hypothetical protein
VPSRRNISALLFAVSLCAAGAPARACIVQRDDDETAFLAADLIFVGDLTDYEIVSIDGGTFPRETAVLTYRVEAVLKGKAGETIRLWWPNSTFAYPPAMLRFAPSVVAAVQGERRATNWTDSFRYPSEAAITGLPAVHQIPCSPESVFPASPTDIATIKRWIAKGAADGTPLSYAGAATGEPLAARRTSQWNLLPLAAGTIGAAALLPVVWWRRQRKAKRKA